MRPQSPGQFSGGSLAYSSSSKLHLLMHNIFLLILLSLQLHDTLVLLLLPPAVTTLAVLAGAHVGAGLVGLLLPVAIGLLEAHEHGHQGICLLLPLPPPGHPLALGLHLQQGLEEVQVGSSWLDTGKAALLPHSQLN